MILQIGVIEMSDYPTCPLCGRKLYERKSAGGVVCKNWKCDAFWKLGKGVVYDENGDFLEYQRLDEKRDLETPIEIIAKQYAEEIND